MKKLLCLSLLLFTLVSHAADVDQYVSGAWWDTKVATFRVRGAGELRMWFYKDKTILAEFYYNGQLHQTGTGTWADTKSLFKKKVTVIAQGGQILKGTLNTFGNAFIAGLYAGGGDNGRFQCVEPP
jgi:hypothetical protein